VRPVVVVGGGIVGASVAYHLAASGAPVTVLFRDAGVTARSFAWIGGTPGDWPGGASDLRPSVLPDWRRLEQTVAGVVVRRTGSLHWPVSSVHPGQVVVRPGTVEPGLRGAPPAAVHTPGDGAVDAAAVARALLAAARGLGARIVPDAEVSELPSSRVVLAAGTGVAALTAGRVAVPSSPAFLMRLRGPAGLVRTIVSTPRFQVREASGGVLLATAPLDGSPSPRALAGETLGYLRAAFGPGLRLTGWAVGDRPMPAGGPVIGPLDRSVYVAVMHSAVCLAPVAGRLIAQEILTGRAAPQLERCRPSGRQGGRPLG
jgi:glycine/D-amino acid oxidase-like deaminating enzyme